MNGLRFGAIHVKDLHLGIRLWDRSNNQTFRLSSVMPMEGYPPLVILNDQHYYSAEWVKPGNPDAGFYIPELNQVG